MAEKTNKIDHLKTLHYSKIDFAFITAFADSMKATFIVGLITYIGGSEFWINLCLAIPSIMGLLQVPGTFIARTLPSYKPFVLWSQSAWRLLHIPLIFIPFLPVSINVKLFLLLFFLSIASVGYQISMPVINEWLSQIVPSNSRGWFFSKRNSIAAGTTALVGFLGGLWIDYFREKGNEALGYSLLFSFLIGAACLSLLNYRQMRDMPRKSVQKFDIKDMHRGFLLPFQEKRLRDFLFFSMVFTAGLYFNGNLYTSYGLKILNMPISFFQITGMAQGLGYVLSAKMWGYLADKYGNKPSLTIVSFGSFFTPAVWIICIPNELTYNLSWLICSHILSGVFWSGAATCHLNLLFAVSPKEKLSETITVGMFTQALIMGISPLIAGSMIVNLLHYFDVTTSYYIIFITGMAFRLLAIILLNRVDEVGSSSLKDTLKQLKSMSPQGYMAFRELAKSSDSKTREKAIANVGWSHLTLVTDEIIKALQDPAPRVRRQAAVTLGKLDQVEASKAIVNILENFPNLVEEETIEALGRSTSKVGVDTLIKYLENPRSTLRRAAARALGRIGDKKAIPVLIEITQNTPDSDLKRAVLQSLRILEAKEAIPLVVESLADQDPTIKIAAAEAVSELKILGVSNILRESLVNENDEASSELCYALGCVGNQEDIPLMLQTASLSSTSVARRRCLLGVAKLIGCESKFYSFLLIDGMNRDNTILELFREKIKKSKWIKQSLDSYFDGEEEVAMKELSQYAKDDIVNLFHEKYVEDIYILSACYLSLRWKNR